MREYCQLISKMKKIIFDAINERLAHDFLMRPGNNRKLKKAFLIHSFFIGPASALDITVVVEQKEKRPGGIPPFTH